ncbi:MAG: DNA polymerase III subunit gamma/tau, partial [Eubacteriales bacterium]|nr:DNA polymerase III subunit gamma/tau [Eubacteriales bacterium]
MYLALYRKYRPTRFDEMVGQEYVRKTLRSQVKTGRISHAYLFCGLRGTGKTTAAKIFAAAINCPNSGADGEPCGVCPTCQMLRSESNLDVIEIDAASNNGVDQIRELRDKVVYPPQHGRYKVYIIDEVHMLTGSAFNAMLKTLEEPPAHAVFILATTEVQKLPATILSRCQRFDFKHISMADIITRMKTVLDDLGAGYDERALSLIASVADGGMRDALSMADMCLSYEGERPCITYENTLEVLGTMDRGFLFD